jgi:inositol hexakisphosphate/diphosphoinositol-pentakisphosphate kinase
MFDVLRNKVSKFQNKINSRRRGSIKKISLGICAMDKKAQSKPMKEILSRLSEDVFEVTIFGNQRILEEPIETWPVVECLIAFYSKNFPTEKVVQYVELRRPMTLNDLKMEDTLADRRKVYRLLMSVGIQVPRHVFLEREDSKEDGSVVAADTNSVEEFDEYVIINGVTLNKPLVEKPVDAEDHGVYIYYPISAGGGSKRLFRKVSDRSSTFYPDVNELRKTGSYIYEEFLVTQGTDVKVYTVGPDYYHAEARKSPVVDGKVNRDAAGLEVRRLTLTRTLPLLLPLSPSLPLLLSPAIADCRYIIRLSSCPQYMCISFSGWLFPSC